jgi:hypothetical protein
MRPSAFFVWGESLSRYAGIRAGSFDLATLAQDFGCGLGCPQSASTSAPLLLYAQDERCVESNCVDGNLTIRQADWRTILATERD